jgi:hypothetical protein
MIRLNLDHHQQTELAGVDDAQLCDVAGRPLGHFLSEGLYRRLVYDWANAQVTEEEIERRRESPNGRKLSEIVARLRAS